MEMNSFIVFLVGIAISLANGKFFFRIAINKLTLVIYWHQLCNGESLAIDFLHYETSI